MAQPFVYLGFAASLGEFRQRSAKPARGEGRTTAAIVAAVFLLMVAIRVAWGCGGRLDDQIGVINNYHDQQCAFLDKITTVFPRRG